eukprot:COSAG01_NODE_165_length_23303_cov_269.524953_12_plen_271_part_00
MSLALLNDIITRLTDEEQCWEAMLELKFLQDKACEPLIIKALKHQHAVVRWVMAERCADLQLESSIALLFDLLEDQDKQVRNTAYKSLKSMRELVVLEAILRLQHPLVLTRKAADKLIFLCRDDALPSLAKALKVTATLTQQLILSLTWRISPFKAEAILIEALAFPDVAHYAILLLGQLKSRFAILPLIKAYQHARLRAAIHDAFKSIGEEQVYPLVAQYLLDPDLQHSCIIMSKKMGQAILPYIRTCIQESRSESNVTWRHVVQQLRV